MARRRYTNFSNHTSSTRDTRRSTESYDSGSTAPTSMHDSPRPSSKGSASRYAKYGEDLSPSTSICPRSSVETYSSLASSEELAELRREESIDYSEIPPLPAYIRDPEDFNVRPSTPEDFAALFPSIDRLTIRHDDFTSDGNMNLRVDTVASGRRRRAIQLFHLRMYDLAKREFSLRRYCRESGREVCNSKRKYVEPATTGHPVLQRSVTAMRTLAGRPALGRVPTAGSMFSTRSRPGTSYSTAEASDTLPDVCEHEVSDERSKAHPLPTNAIKLEFSNYARVDIERRGNNNSTRYEFQWWGHNYTWKRVADKLTGTVSFHLLKDGHNNTPVAHMVPETRSPREVDYEEDVGGWVPPYQFWISDEKIVNAMTDVADVVIATGLISLVDDCINERWHHKKIRRISLPLTSKTMDVELVSPRTFVQHLFARRHSYTHHHRPVGASSLRHQKAVAAH
ncbi:hypothetical protein F4778DRAFT_435206 [Xylariomycetidae sp. FL2044]|nr:hypothetical protein F4778DRAFT_435206 [Xylariomycetidae sp. FL2044]